MTFPSNRKAEDTKWCEPITGDSCHFKVTSTKTVPLAGGGVRVEGWLIRQGLWDGSERLHVFADADSFLQAWFAYGRKIERFLLPAGERSE